MGGGSQVSGSGAWGGGDVVHVREQEETWEGRRRKDRPEVGAVPQDDLLEGGGGDGLW